MKVCIISDSRLPAAWDYPGHGLGKHCLGLGKMIKDMGHEPFLVAAPGSKFDDGLLLEYKSLPELATMIENGLFTKWEFDVIIDSSHKHVIYKHTDIPVLNFSSDRENSPGPNGIFPSKAHMDFHHANGTVLPNSVDTDVFTFNDTPDDYFLFMSTPHPEKGFKSAYHVARKKGLRLIVAGSHTEDMPFGIGPVAGERKVRLLRNARALLFPSPHEAGPITVLESMSCGTPVLCYNKGGAAEYVEDGLTGYCAESQEELEWCTEGVGLLSRQACREHVERNFTQEVTSKILEQLLERQVSGEI